MKITSAEVLSHDDFKVEVSYPIDRGLPSMEKIEKISEYIPQTKDTKGWEKLD